jgi:two-component system, chemotaxis family, protein-glutamate methylesterase/glutaminase
MTKRDIIVIGSSAGGVAPLLELARSLPEDFPASIFIVQHIPPYAQSSLPELLSKAGPLRAIHPKPGEPIQPRRIYVAPPDHHLLLEDEKVIVARGPKENRFRPSIDVLFRSAAYLYGSRVIGVVLSGVLDDGTSGLWAIKRMGGLAVIQDPTEAVFPDMPSNVLEYIKVDHKVRAAEMGALLVRLASNSVGKKPKLPAKELRRLNTEIVIATRDNAFEMGIIEMGELTAYTCPECNGALSQLKEGKIVRFRCHTGHAFTISALLSEVSESVESLLWQAMRGLEESNLLLEEMGKRFEQAGRSAAAHALLRKAKEVKKQARVVHDSVMKQELISGDLFSAKSRK